MVSRGTVKLDIVTNNLGRDRIRSLKYKPSQRIQNRVLIYRWYVGSKSLKFRECSELCADGDTNFTVGADYRVSHDIESRFVVRASYRIFNWIWHRLLSSPATLSLWTQNYECLRERYTVCYSRFLDEHEKLSSAVKLVWHGITRWWFEVDKTPVTSKLSRWWPIFTKLSPEMWRERHDV